MMTMHSTLQVVFLHEDFALLLLHIIGHFQLCFYVNLLLFNMLI